MVYRRWAELSAELVKETMLRKIPVVENGVTVDARAGAQVQMHIMTAEGREVSQRTPDETAYACAVDIAAGLVAEVLARGTSGDRPRGTGAPCQQSSLR